MDHNKDSHLQLFMLSRIMLLKDIILWEMVKDSLSEIEWDQGEWLFLEREWVLAPIKLDCKIWIQETDEVSGFLILEHIALDIGVKDILLFQ